MNSPSTPFGRCHRCGTLLSAAVADGLCPSCLTRALFLEETATSPEEVEAVSQLPKIGDYELLERIGRGGMGIVYRARQVSLNREVAVKILADSVFASRDELARFQAEAAAAAALRHPNIVAIHDIGEQEGQRFFSMDLITGKDLAALAREGPLPARRAAELVRKLADALHHVHERGILHRDLKPSNVLIDDFGEPHVTDFGLSKRMSSADLSNPACTARSGYSDASSSSPLTVTGQILGTPGYMSPEQAGSKRTIGPATDIYSLGALLYHLVSGRAPFVGENPTSVLRQVEEEEPVAPRLLNPILPADLETICLKCLSKEPARRYESAKALAGDLQRFLRGEPILARPVGRAERLWHWCRRRPWVASLVALSSFLLLTLVAVTLFARLEITAEAESLRRRDYVADMRLVGRAIEEDDLGQAVGLLDKWRPGHGGLAWLRLGKPLEDLRDFEWRYYTERCRGDEISVIRHHADRVLRVAFSPDGQRFASASADGELCLWDAQSQSLLGQASHEKRIMTLAFSPDGSWLASGGDDRRVRLWNATNLEPVGPGLQHNSALVTMCFTGERAHLACIARREFVLWDVQDQNVLRRQPISPSTWFYGAISPKLEAVALPMPGMGHVKIWDFPPTTVRGTLGDLSAAVAFSKDGSLLAEGEFSGQLKVWRVSDLENVLSLPAHAGVVRGLAWSPDGRRLATGGRDGLLKLWEFPGGKLLRTYRGHCGVIVDIAFSPDGSRLVTCSVDQTVRFWDATAAPEVRENPSRSDKAFVRERGTFWVTGDYMGSDTAWINPRTLEQVPVPVPTEFRSSNAIVRVVEDGFLVFGPSPELRHFNSTGQQVGAVAKMPEWPISMPTVSLDARWVVWRPSLDEVASQRLWRVGSTNAPVNIEEPDKVWILPTFAPNNQLLAAINLEGAVAVWDLRQQRIAHRFQAVRGAPTGLQFSRDSTRLVVSSEDVKVWNTRAWDQAPIVLSTGPDPVWCVNFSPNGRRVIAGGDDGDLFLWDLATAQMVARLKTPEHRLIDLVQFSANGEELMASEAPTVFVWHAPRSTNNLHP